MAGYTDAAFRELCRAHGAALTVTEMTSVRGIVHGSAATEALMRLSPTETPSCVQLFGSDPRDFAVAAQKMVCDIIDINMGCPMPKIVKNGDGAALLKNPERAGDIVRAIRDVTDRPVTVKTRLGYAVGDGAAYRLCECVEKAGAAAITVHGRYAEQRYSAKTDYDAIERIAKATGIPVIASGDISAESAAETEERFDAIMIGRAALSDPSVFGKGKCDPYEYAAELLAGLTKYFDARYTVNQARKFFVHIFKGVPGGKAIRAAVNSAQTVEEVYAALNAPREIDG